jgi:predicted 3-demethylubiquinone-9 3-methyltransferase (glyoxalase superfamily)
MTAKFLIEWQEFVALNGGPACTFSPAISFVVNCGTQEEVDELWEKLLKKMRETTMRLAERQIRRFVADRSCCF